MAPDEFNLEDLASSQSSNGRAASVDQVNSVMTAQSSCTDPAIVLEISATSFPSQKLESVTTTPSLSSDERSLMLNSSIDKEDESIKSWPTRSSSSLTSFVDSPLTLSSTCEGLSSTADNAEIDGCVLLVPSSQSTCACSSSQWLSSSSALPLSSSSEPLINTGKRSQHPIETTKSILLEMSTCSVSSQRDGVNSVSTQSSGGDGLRSRDNADCVSQTILADKIINTGLPEEAPSASSAIMITSSKSNPFNGSITSQFRTEKSCRTPTKPDNSVLLPYSSECPSKSDDTCGLCRGPPCSSSDGSLDSYDFLIFNHDDDTKIANRIFDFLEEEHPFRGFKIGRDDIPGTHKIDEIIKAINKSEKILLLLSLKSIIDEKFQFLMKFSFEHSIKKGCKLKIIPIRLGIEQEKLPELLKYKYNINYEDCNLKFQTALLKVFCQSSSHLNSMGHRSVSDTTSPRGGSSVKSSDSPKLKQSHSVPTSTRPPKKWYTRFLFFQK